MPRGLGLRLLAACAAGGLVLAACGDPTESGGDEPTSAPEVEPSSSSSPFTVGEVPEGYVPVVAGRGTAQADWGSDSFGTHEPYTVLSPDGRADHPDVVVVSITGFEGYQGQLGQASNGYMSAQRETFTIDGRDAIYAPAGEALRGPLWADLVAVRGDDLAVRVTSPDATRDELVAVLEHVEVPDDRRTAPAVDPPDGLQVVGSVDVDAVLAFGFYVRRASDQVPGPPSAHGAGWLHSDAGDGQQLVVVTLPGGSVDLSALPAVHGMSVIAPRVDVRAREVDGSAAVLVEGINDPRDAQPGSTPWSLRSLWMESDWGDVIVVSSSGPATPTEDELVAVARSVRRTDGGGWERFVVDMTGGPGLGPDPGHHELARGQVGDLEWVLQDGPPGAGTGAEYGAGQLGGVDPCLKLSNRQRLCAQFMAGSPDDWMARGDWPSGGSFVLISTTIDAPSARVATAGDEATGALVPVPDSEIRAAIVTIDDPGDTAWCGDPDELLDHLSGMRVDALDERGEVQGCLGMGPVAYTPDDG